MGSLGGGGEGAVGAGNVGEVLVSTAWLAAKLQLQVDETPPGGGPRSADPAIRVIDVRGKVLPPGSKPRYLAKRADYDAAHVPGAVFVDWTVDLVDPSDPVPMQVAAPDAFASLMTRLGIGKGTLVVAYDDYDHIFAGRFAWALRYYGHDAVRILDGGWSRWIGESRPTQPTRPSRLTAPVAPGSDTENAASKRVARASDPPSAVAPFEAHASPGLRRTADDVERALGRNDLVLIDARPSEQYEGKVTAASRAGHIPGARNVPYARLVDAKTGRFLPSSELARVFKDSGVDVDALPREIIVYCNGGVSCTVPLNALRILGRDDVAVYDGSWNEWGDDPSRPIRSGREP